MPPVFTAMMDDSKVSLLLGVEAQSEVHYAMPVRNMVYDALQYAAQVEEEARFHREARKAGDSKERAKKLLSASICPVFTKRIV